MFLDSRVRFELTDVAFAELCLTGLGDLEIIFVALLGFEPKRLPDPNSDVLPITPQGNL